MSVFSEILTQLSVHSAMVDAGTVNNTDFCEFQKIAPRIENAYTVGYFDWNAKSALLSIYRAIKADYRVVLCLNR